MDVRSRDDGEARFRTYVEGLASVIGHADRVGPLRDYCTGLLLPCERKSVEPMAAVTAPARVGGTASVAAAFRGGGRWSDEAVLAKVREMVLPAIERHGPIEAWIIDDTGFPKKGVHSVGVTHQYCGQLGKQDNCQVAVSLSIANHHASLPVAYRLYLPKDWAEDAERRRKAGVPEEIGFQTKPEIALDQLAGCASGASARRRADGCGLWHGRHPARGDRGARPRLCGRHAVERRSGRGRGRWPSQRPRTAADASGTTAEDGWSRSRLALACRRRLADDHVARRRSRGFASRFARVRVRASRRGLHGRRARGVAADRMARRRGGADQVLALHAARAASPSTASSTSPCCAGASSATTRSSSRRSGSATSKAEAGAASTTTPRCASPPTAS